MGRKRAKSNVQEAQRAEKHGETAAGGASVQSGMALLPFGLSRWATLWAAGLIALATFTVYSNTFRNPFIFDDGPCISGNPTIRSLWPIGRVLSPPVGTAVQRRPIVNLSLAINYAISGDEVWSYHALNLLGHLLAALLLFGIVRRTLLSASLQERWRRAALPLAFTVALLWAVHPLLTEAVTYVVQRTEVLAGLFYLLTLYCLIRGAGSNPKTGTGTATDGGSDCATLQPVAEPVPVFISSARGWAWYAGAVAACALAMGSKEAAISAPLVVLLYDRVFLSPSWRAVFRRRWALYVGLASTWAVILVMLPRGYEGTRVFAVPQGAEAVRMIGENYRTIDYTLAQFGVIAHYLWLCFWPHPLVVDYGLYTAQTAWQIVPYALLIGGLLAAALAAFRYQPWLGFLGVWFFAILAPSSSVVPLFQQIAAEKRMYLPLAAVATVVTIGGYLAGRRLIARGILSRRAAQITGVGLILLVGIALAALTLARNATYRDQVLIWDDVVAKMPDNARAHNNLAVELLAVGRADKAITHCRKALELKPRFVDPYNNLGMALASCGRTQDAITQYRKAVELKPDYAEAHNNLGNALAVLNRVDEAMAEYRKALQLKPDYIQPYVNLGVAYVKQGRTAEAMAEYRKALELDPDDAEAHNNLGNVLAELKRSDDAMAEYREALRSNPKLAQAHYCFARTLLNCGKPREALVEYQQAVELKPDWAEARYNLAATLAGQGRFAEAVTEYQKTLELKPDYVEARYNLATILLNTRRLDEALDQFQKILEVKPNLPEAHFGLGMALADSGRVDEAIGEYRKAVTLKPDYADAFYNLATALAATDRFREAAGYYRKVTQIEPNSADACNDLARLLAACPDASVRNGGEAVVWAKRAVELSGGREPVLLDTLAAAYAEAGQFPDALQTAEKALDMATKRKNWSLAKAIETKIELYRAGRPYREPRPARTAPRADK